MAAVVYVCDEGHAARLAISLESWRRFRTADVYVTDFGLSQPTRQRLHKVYGVTLLKPSLRVPMDAERRVTAYREKTRAPMIVAEIGHANSEPIIMLDSDIIVFDDSFFQLLEHVGDGEVTAVASAWDVDFTWTYRSAAEPVLREISGIPEFDLLWAIPNSGVVSARASAWCTVCPIWTSIYDSFLGLPNRQALIRPGALPGDQEFLPLALARIGYVWRHLHGSCNMQVSPERMSWGAQTRHPFFGGHFREPPDIVRALHYGVGSDGAIAFSDGMLANSYARAAVAAMIEELREAAIQRGWVFPDSADARLR